MITRSLFIKKRIWLLVLLVVVSISFWKCLPEPLFDEPVSRVLLSSENHLLGAHISADEQWRFPPLESVPEKFAASIVAFEDQYFYQHFGVDPLAIARAIKLNLQAGKIVSGGSTLSMQVIRLSRHNPPRSFWTKLLETIQALRLETRYSKQQILALYASYAPFGGNVVGLEAASWRYFGRSPGQLSWAESAMLAVLPNSPALIHLGRNRKRLKAKRDRLLQKLYALKKINQLDYALALAEPLPLKPKPLPRLAPHLLNTLAAGKHFHAKVKSKATQQRFHTTLDSVLQKNINKIAAHHAGLLSLQEIYNLAILVIDNRNFEVKAYVGNVPPGNPKGRQLEHGEAIDLVQRPRSTGSTLKPFLFASMIEQGEILPETLIADTPVRYAGYHPRNFDRHFRGAVRAKQALASSLNVPAVNMLSDHGVGRFLASLRQMGMSTLHRRSREYGLPLVLGGAEGTLWELTSLYANLSKVAQQKSKESENYHFEAVVLQGGDTHTKRINTISPASAWMTLQALLEVSRPGSEGYWKRFNSSHKIAWKTGTSFGHRDAWAIGTTPRYTVGVWVGNAAGEGRQGMTGLKVAAPILFDVFNRLDLTTGWFKKPLKQMKTVSICKDDGFLANENCESILYQIPENSHFDRTSPNHMRIHLDVASHKRVHSQCEAVANMRHKSWFVLPPDEAFYYQQLNPDYPLMPPWRNDCKTLKSSRNRDNPISIVYPQNNTQIYLPKQLSDKRGHTVFRAIHQYPDATIYWHLDNQFLGITQTFHEQSISASAGEHKIALVDNDGNRIERRFNVLNERSK